MSVGCRAVTGTATSAYGPGRAERAEPALRVLKLKPTLSQCDLRMD